MALAHRIYKTYALDLSRDVGETHYLSVIADQPPYEQPDGTDVGTFPRRKPGRFARPMRRGSNWEKRRYRSRTKDG